ncbi:hypothetical protein HYW21_06495 [Candidatus Woesearchaeota archaeon]|nr:hypothetical protein [Candidatus Woesearchaeota archaeon]
MVLHLLNNRQEQTSKSLIINALEEQWPMSLKQIHYWFLRKQHKTISRQAVFKALRELVAQGIVIKKGNNYELDKEWIQEICEKTADLYLRYHRRTFLTKQVSKEDKFQVFSFRNIREVMSFIMKGVDNAWFNTSEEKKVFIQVQRLFPLLFSAEQMAWIKSFTRTHDCYVACRGKQIIDRFTQKSLQSLGFHIVIGQPNIANYSDSLVIGNCLLESHIDDVDPMKPMLHQFYKHFKHFRSLQDFDLQSKFMNQKGDILVIISRYPQIVQTYRKQVEDCFYNE